VAPAAQPTTSTAECLYANTDPNGLGSAYVLAAADPQGCPDQLLVQLLAGNTGGAWNLEPVAGSGVPGTEVCSLTASNTGPVAVYSTEKYLTVARAACGGLEQAGLVPD
jgi:hypothetical protein